MRDEGQPRLNFLARLFLSAAVEDKSVEVALRKELGELKSSSVIYFLRRGGLPFERS